MQPSAICEKLEQHKQSIEKQTMRELFKTEPTRAEHYSMEAAGLYLDYSKNRINDQTLALLSELAEESGLRSKIDAMFNGEKINLTEKRAVLHTALRNRSNRSVVIEGQDVMPLIHKQLQKIQGLVEAIHSGKWLGYSGKAIKDVVNIGIGGSDLGPKMMVSALSPYHTRHVNCHFVSNVDGTDIAETLKNLNPETTLFIVASKSFTTQETLMNALTARKWLLDKAHDEAATAKHFVAISSKPDKAKAFGINPENCFEMWDWVGGRYSLWSSIGLPIALAIGMEHFIELLEGAHAMDEHFKTAELPHNMPVILALLGIWYNNFFNAHSYAILPYDDYLEYLPAYLQQADMESNGKSVTIEGKPVTYATGPIIWGGAGTNGQHAFHQLLHQGTPLVPVDFIVPLKSHNPIGEHHAALFANCLAQSQAFMQGKTLEEAYQELLKQGMPENEAKALAPHKVIAGNKPNNMIVAEQFTPKTIGALVALYEHKIFVQSVIWNINAFDQWGVELGKQLGEPILASLLNKNNNHQYDGSTESLIARFKRASGQI
ncbi:MAG: glucose-6-phosphate isomerase [Gammaproteobacteria bacterium]|nr:glucose-6-phosphate isomerase [Gammaproteobacteria bacterium]